jgi:hypothetical protein
MSLSSRANYYRRIVRAYLTPGRSHLTFWHEVPQINQQARFDQLGPYYMQFAEKADYAADLDPTGIPMLNYRGVIGRQYNPIAIAQWGLGNYNCFVARQEPERRRKFLLAAGWLVAHLASNPRGVPVWLHHFDWEYRTTLKAPWYSALAQGQGLSLLVRAHRETSDARYLAAARQAFSALTLPIKQGGTLYTDDHGDCWIEEYIVSPPTHILNGFIWAMWGVYDYALATGDSAARDLFAHTTRTLLQNLSLYDTGHWSLYEQSQTRLPMLASPFYHRLHIVQLKIMHQMTGENTFAVTAARWQQYAQSPANCTRALAHKALFKVLYY